VSKVSAWRKAGVVARVASQQASRSRTVKAAVGAARATVRSFSRVLHLLFLEVTGTVFLTLALFGVTAVVREYMKYTAGHAPFSRVVVAAAFTLTFVWFGMSSFVRARRKSRS
jgi:hypothetical protein